MIFLDWLTETESSTTTNAQESSTNAVTSQQTPTSEQTSSGLTTVAQSIVTSSSPPDVHCCCRCCFPSSPTCTFCDRDTLADSSECANKPPTTPTPVNRETPKFEAPAALQGSAFPERLALREDFIKKEQLTETLAALPESTKVDLGFKNEELIVDCQYDGTECDLNT